MDLIHYDIFNNGEKMIAIIIAFEFGTALDTIKANETEIKDHIKKM